MSQNRRGIQLRNIQQSVNSSKGQPATTQRIRLRRNVTKQQVIEQNLSHMQQSAQKKKVAQELYYSQQGGSPLLRVNTAGNRAPVHKRLGHNKFLNNITRNPRPRLEAGNRIKLRKYPLQPDQLIGNNIIRRRNDKMRRVQSAQNRIIRIRQNNQTQFKQMGQNNGQKVRLRRMQPPPVNYTVQVVNNTKNNVLSPKLQEEIRLIQTKSIQHAEIPPIPIHPQGTGFTGTTLHERFSQL